MKEKMIAVSEADLFATEIQTRAIDSCISVLAEAGNSKYSQELVSPATVLLRGGKRLRAKACAVGAYISGGAAIGHDMAALDVGAALELYQASALVHDDIIDNANTRRGFPSAHQEARKLHIEANWIGDSNSFGTGSAILLGDLLLSAAFKQLHQSLKNMTAPAAAAVLERFTTMTAEVALGQYMDLRAEQIPWDQGIDLAAAQEVALLKSARYSVAHPVLLGAQTQGASPDFLNSLLQITLPWGQAYQLRDDDLGIFGDTLQTGKPAGEDLREGKRTVLVALTWEKTNEDGKKLLRNCLGNKNLSKHHITNIRKLMIDCGARQAHETLITSLRNTGDAILAELSLPTKLRNCLSQLGDELLNRDH